MVECRRRELAKRSIVEYVGLGLVPRPVRLAFVRS